MAWTAEARRTGGAAGLRRAGKWLAIGIPALLLLIQLVPYGHDHTNPPVTAEPQWDSPRTQQLAMQSCFDCHSNQTRWPWYTNVAPASWLTQNHVDEGRRALNFSTWNAAQPPRRAREAAETVQRGEMPPRDYLLLHPDARLSGADKQALVDGLTKAFGTGGGRRTGSADPYREMILVAQAAAPA